MAALLTYFDNDSAMQCMFVFPTAPLISAAYRTALCQNRRFFSKCISRDSNSRPHWNKSENLTMVFLRSFRVERCISCPNRTSHSGAKCKTVKSRTTYHRHVSYDNKRAATDFAIFPPMNCVELHLPLLIGLAVLAQRASLSNHYSRVKGVPPSLTPMARNH